MIFTLFVGKKKIGRIEAKDLDAAEEVANTEFPEWTDIYIGDRDLN